MPKKRPTAAEKPMAKKPTDKASQILLEMQEKLRTASFTLEDMRKQLRQIKKWAYHHKSVFTFLYGRYLMSIYMIMFSGLIAGLALIFVSKQGSGVTSGQSFTRSRL